MLRISALDAATPLAQKLQSLGITISPKANTELEMKYSVAASLPKSKSNGVKNASLGFGKLFGSDLNRNDTIVKEARLNPKQKLEKIKKMFQELEENIPSKANEKSMLIDGRITEKESKRLINILGFVKVKGANEVSNGVIRRYY